MNLCLYKPEMEENLFIRKRAKTWQRSGLLSEDQLRIVEERTATQLSVPSLFFRILYFIFSCVCLTAAVGLVIWILDADDEGPIGFIFLVFSIPTYGLAELFVRKHGFYRHGIEEALALTSLGLFCGGIVLIILSLPGYPGNDEMFSISAALVCLSAIWLYLRFGFIYAALIVMFVAPALLLFLDLSPTAMRVCIFSFFGLLLLYSLRSETEISEDFRKRREGVVQAFLFASMYLTINLRIFTVAEAWFDQRPPFLIPYAGFPPAVYWTTYILSYLLPITGLYLAITNRKRPLMNVAAIALALSLATNKDYLGLKHYAWDPIIFGATLILAAVFIIYWLAAGRNKERHGFTAESILKPEQYGLSLPEIGAATLPGITSAPVETAPPAPSLFEDGQSGGGGASRNF